MAHIKIRTFKIEGVEGFGKVSETVMSNSEDSAREDALKRHPFMKIQSVLHTGYICCDIENLKKIIEDN